MSKEQLGRQDDPAQLQVITPQKRDFQMLVTPRYVGCYCDDSYEDFTADLLLKLAADDMLFIDIGAHYGYYTLLVGTKHRKCKIIAIEPVPTSYEIAGKNIQLNQLENVALHNIALTNKSETRRFNIAEASDCSGFDEHPLKETVKVVELEAVSLDSLVDKAPGVPIIVKVDTEGHEPHVLQGMERLIKNSADIKLIIEFNPKCLRNAGHEPEGFLEQIIRLGFDVYAIDDTRRLTYKVDEDRLHDWVSYLPGRDEQRTANLLCIKQEASLSVCFFSHSAELDDAGRSLLALTRHLGGRGAACSVVVPGDGPLKDELVGAGASVLSVGYSPWCSTSPLPAEEMEARSSRSFESILDMLAEFARINPDVVFTNTLLIPWGALVAAMLGKPHVWSIHDSGDLRFHLPRETVARFVEEFSSLTLVGPGVTADASCPIPRSKSTITLRDDFESEEGAKEAIGLISKLKDTAGASLEGLFQLAARAVVEPLRTRDAQIARLSLTLKARDTQTRRLQANVQKQESRIARLEERLGKRDSRVATLEERLQKRDSRIAKLPASFEPLNQRVTELESERAALYSSYSRRITTPLRAAYGGLRRLVRRSRRTFRRS